MKGKWQRSGEKGEKDGGRGGGEEGAGEEKRGERAKDAHCFIMEIGKGSKNCSKCPKQRQQASVSEQQ